MKNIKRSFELFCPIENHLWRADIRIVYVEGPKRCSNTNNIVYYTTTVCRTGKRVVVQASSIGVYRPMTTIVTSFQTRYPVGFCGKRFRNDRRFPRPVRRSQQHVSLVRSEFGIVSYRTPPRSFLPAPLPAPPRRTYDRRYRLNKYGRIENRKQNTNSGNYRRLAGTLLSSSSK